MSEMREPLVNPGESMGDVLTRRRAARHAIGVADDHIAAALERAGMTPDDLVTSPFGGNSSSTEYWEVSAVKLAELLLRLSAPTEGALS